MLGSDWSLLEFRRFSMCGGSDGAGGLSGVTVVVENFNFEDLLAALLLSWFGLIVPSMMYPSVLQ